MSTTIIIAVLLIGMFVGASMFAAYAFIGARYDAEENNPPKPSYELPTGPWPAPR